jgi:hypothetical protein
MSEETTETQRGQGPQPNITAKARSSRGSILPGTIMGVTLAVIFRLPSLVLSVPLKIPIANELFFLPQLVFRLTVCRHCGTPERVLVRDGTWLVLWGIVLLGFAWFGRRLPVGRALVATLGIIILVTVVMHLLFPLIGLKFSFNAI